MFSYSATWRKGDKQKNIDKLKKACLESVRKTLEFLSTLSDDKLLERLEEEEWEDK